MKGCEKHKDIPQRGCVECGKANCEDSRPEPCSVTVLDEEHTFYCPKCGRLLHAEKIHMDDPHCYFCGENLQIEITSPNAEVSHDAKRRCDH